MDTTVTPAEIGPGPQVPGVPDGAPGVDPAFPFNRPQLARELQSLAAAGIFLGTSSWKYPGWIGSLYERDRYVWRGRFATSRFERLCLTEYAEVFPTVCVDAAYYTFPTPSGLTALAAQVPSSFRFGFKVTDAITLKRFPRLERFGARAGEVNADFLHADRFVSDFLGPCESIREQVGILMFEFTRFHSTDYERGLDFVRDLDAFLDRLPKGWPYGVEIRNPSFLHPDYFACLARHGVAHVYNSWERMPSLAEQMALRGSRTSPELTAARLLLRPGRAYADAVKAFQPYDQVRDPYPEGRQAAAALLKASLQATGRGKSYVYVNNRLEGNALATIQNVVAILLAGAPSPAS